MNMKVRLSMLFACALLTASAGAQDVTVTLPRSVATQIARQVQPARAGLAALGDSVYAQDLLPVQMRDGTRLSGLVILSRALPLTAKRPVILVKTPYKTESTLDRLMLQLLRRMLDEGYAVVIVNDRGQQWSEGSYQWLRGANNDNWDMLDWVQKQEWSNGRVGAVGCSSSAEWQIPFATHPHPALKAIIPMGAATGVGEIPGYADQGIWYDGGVPQMFWGWWFYEFGYLSHPEIARSASLEQRRRIARTFSPDPQVTIPEDLLQHLPSADILKAAGTPQTVFDELSLLEPGSPGWGGLDFLRTGDHIRIPALHVDSWYDLVEIYPTTKMFEYVSQNSANQYLLVGPTNHCREGTESAHTMIGDQDMGDARFDYVSVMAKFFDHWVKNDGAGAFDVPRVQYYMLHDKWRTAPAWPLPGIKATRLYLRADGGANSLAGDGRLDPQPAPGAERADTFIYDPQNPVPSHAASCCSEPASLDQREIESRADVLVYTSMPLHEPVELVGYVKAHLYLSSDAPDTDLMVKLIDVYPDGRAFNLFDAAKRVRYRNGIHKVEMMKPGSVYPVDVDQIVTAVILAPEHRLRIEVSSSNFPAYERNLNTGGSNQRESVGRVARNSIWHDPEHQSFLEISLTDTSIWK